MFQIKEFIFKIVHKVVFVKIKVKIKILFS
jgi:hypothetical protein